MKRITPATVVVLFLTGAVAGGIRPRQPANVRQSIQVVKLRLIAEGKEVARISTPDGTMATMSREGGEFIGLTPYVQDDGLSLTVAVKDGLTGEFEITGRFSLVHNVPIDVSTERTPLFVEWLDTIETPSVANVPGRAPCTACCICAARTEVGALNGLRRGSGSIF